MIPQGLDPNFDHGVLWAVARLVEFYDEPTMAGEILQQSGANADLADELDGPFIARAIGAMASDAPAPKQAAHSELQDAPGQEPG